MSMSNKRRVPRRELHARVGILLAGRYSIARSHEIGEGGMLLSSDQVMKKDDRLVLTFRIPEVLSGVVIATVIYITEDGFYGLNFDKIEFDVKRKIRNFVASSTALEKRSGTSA